MDTKNLVSIAYVVALAVVFLIFFMKPLKRYWVRHQQPEYVFWTGGYDSTFLLCDLLIVKKRVVQPIYVRYNLDSQNNTDFWVRKNRVQEQEAMEKIRDYVVSNFPNTRSLFLDTIYVEKDSLNEEFVRRFQSMKLFPRKRKIHQYTHLAKIAHDKQIYVNCGVLGLHSKKRFERFIYYFLGPNSRLRVPKSHPLHFVKFPLFKQSKKDLCKYSQQHGFDEVLTMTWSCWFPSQSQTCGRCPMCRERYKCSKF